MLPSTRAKKELLLSRRVKHNDSPKLVGVVFTRGFEQECPVYNTLREMTWPHDTPVTQKLYGDLEDLRRTASFLVETGLSI